MMTPHVPDRELAQWIDGELAAGRASLVRDHLQQCGSCRLRQSELELSGSEFDVNYSKQDLPDPSASRAALLAKLRGRGETMPSWTMAAAGIAAAILAAAIAWRAGFAPNTLEAGSTPIARLTPGATRAISFEAICSSEPGGRIELSHVAADVAEQVFRRYGIESPRPRTYEIDYLIPPDLGGSEDPRNLWPQPYARGVWNARVKDALEERLRTLFCEGKLDLATAQRELARDWIGAYKRYFRSDQPLIDHAAFHKDSPWE